MPLCPCPTCVASSVGKAIAQAFRPPGCLVTSGRSTFVVAWLFRCAQFICCLAVAFTPVGDAHASGYHPTIVGVCGRIVGSRMLRARLVDGWFRPTLSQVGTRWRAGARGVMCRFVVGTTDLSLVPCVARFVGFSLAIFSPIPRVSGLVGFHSGWFVEGAYAVRGGVLVHGGGLLLLSCLPHTPFSFRCCRGFFKLSRCWCFATLMAR